MIFFENLGMFKDFTQQQNAGYISRILMVPEQSANIDVFGDVYIAEGTEVLELFFAVGDAQLNVKHDGNAFGGSFSYSVNVRVPKFGFVWTEFIKKNRHTQWVLFVQDANEQLHVIGNQNNGCVLNTDGGVQSISQIGLSFFWSGGEPAFCLEGVNINDIVTMGRLIDLRKYDVRDIIAVKGDSLSLDLQFLNDDNTAEDLTGNTFSCKVKNAAGVDILTFTIGNGFTLTNTNKTLVMSRTAAQMAAVAAGEYVYDIQRTYPTGVVETKLKGAFIVESDIS